MDTTTSVEHLQLLTNYFKSKGIDMDKIYQQSGIDPFLLDQPGARIPLIQFHAFWNAAVEQSNDPNIGFNLGKNISFLQGNLLFLILLNTPTIKDAIEKIKEYFCLFSSLFSLDLSIKNNQAEMILQYNIVELSAERHSNESLIAACASVLRHLSGDKLSFRAVYFSHCEPEDVFEHLNFFKAPLYFNQKENKLLFDCEFLDLPVPLSNQNVLESLEKIAQELKKKIYVNESWSHKVINILFQFIGKEKTRLEVIAERLSTTPRNLQKKLKKENVTYQDLLNYARMLKAKYLLKERYSLSDISQILGYSEQSVFNKSFRRWVGSSPMQYRNQY